MYDIKELENNNEINLNNNEPHRVHERSYYHKHLTSNVLTTKLSYIPTDSLL